MPDAHAGRSLIGSTWTAETGRVPVLELAVDRTVTRASPIELSARLQRGDPPVHLSERFAGRDVLIVDPQVLAPEDDALVVAAVRRAAAGG